MTSEQRYDKGFDEWQWYLSLLREQREAMRRLSDQMAYDILNNSFKNDEPD